MRKDKVCENRYCRMDNKIIRTEETHCGSCNGRLVQLE